MRVNYNACIIWPEVCVIYSYRLCVKSGRIGQSVGQVGSVGQVHSSRSVKSVRFGQSVLSDVV